jgi:MerR family transcriptional regulator/heat shock protein HspR
VLAVLPFEDENLPLFTVGQVAQMLDLQQAFLRRLDEFDVVRPSRSSGGQRRYSRTEVTVVRYVAQLCDEGMTLAAVRRVLELEDQAKALTAERDALRAALRDALAERDRLLAALTRRPPGNQNMPGGLGAPDATPGSGRS